MSCAQTEIPKKQKLVINPLALAVSNCNVFNNLKDSKKGHCKGLKKCNQKLHESIVSIKDDEECDISKTVTMETVEKSAVKVNKKKMKVFKFLYQSIIKKSITYSLGLIKDFVLDCDSENVVFADKFPFAVIKFLGLLFDAEQASVKTMLDGLNFKIYIELNELVQNKPFRIFYHFESKFRRISFIKHYIASNDYETLSFIKMVPSEWSLPESEMNMAPEQSFDSQGFDSNVDLKITKSDLGVDTKLIASDEKVTDVGRGSVKLRGSKTAVRDSTELPTAKRMKHITVPRRVRRIDRARVLIKARSSMLQEGLDTPVQCSKAEKMMRNMGWSGGALGVNGTGIMEPIKPEINRKTTYGLGHANAFTDPNSTAQPVNRPTEKKLKKENKKRDIRKEKRTAKMLTDLKIRRELRKREREAAWQEEEAELDVLEGIVENTKKCKLTRKSEKKVNNIKYQMVVLNKLLEFVCNPADEEIWFDQNFSDKKRAQIHRLVDNINEGGRKGHPTVWCQPMVDEICECTASYLVSESFGEGSYRRISISKLPMQSVMFVDEDMLLARKASIRRWNHLEVVAGNMLQLIMAFLQDGTKEEIRFTGEWLTKARIIINNFLGQLKEACSGDMTAPPLSEVQRVMHDSYRRQPGLTLHVRGEIVGGYSFYNICAKIIKVSRKDLRRRCGMIVID